MTFQRVPVQPAARSVARTASFPAPRKGWIRNTNLAVTEKEGASVLDNWFPTSTGARVRKGRTKHATAGTGDAVVSMFTYEAGGDGILFAATDLGIYDVSTPADPDVSPSAAVGVSSGDFSYAPIATAGGYFMRLVNGSDTALVFDGSTWGTTPALTGISSDLLSAVWLFKQRLFFVEDGSLNAWYLPVDSVGGALVKLPLGGVFRLGGSLLFGSSWSYDAAGGTGKADACVFVTTLGEVAIYEGTDPSSTSTWGLKGVYQIGRPLGKRAWFKSGGDLIIATDIGLVAVSQAVEIGTEALSSKAVSYPIEEEWKLEALRRDNRGWSCTLWPKSQMAVIGMPHSSVYSDQCLVVNIRTGAWARYTNWDVECASELNNRLFFGTSDGFIMEAETGGDDNGDIYTAAYLGLFDDLKAPAALKACNLMRTVFLSTTATSRKVSVGVDYSTVIPSAPNVTSLAASGALWDTAVWDDPGALWGDDPVKTTVSGWSSVSGAGTAIAPCVQISLGSAVEPEIDLVRTDIQYELGAVVL